MIVDKMYDGAGGGGAKRKNFKIRAKNPIQEKKKENEGKKIFLGIY